MLFHCRPNRSLMKIRLHVYIFFHLNIKYKFQIDFHPENMHHFQRKWSEQVKRADARMNKRYMMNKYLAMPKWMSSDKNRIITVFIENLRIFFDFFGASLSIFSHIFFADLINLLVVSHSAHIFAYCVRWKINEISLSQNIQIYLTFYLFQSFIEWTNEQTNAIPAAIMHSIALNYYWKF